MTNLLPTFDDTLGPYFPPVFAHRGTLDLHRPLVGLTVAPLGTPISLKVRLVDIDGNLATSSLLEVWHANSRGNLRLPENEALLEDDPFFEGYGRVYSSDGAFLIRSVMPGETRIDATTLRAPWFTLTIFSDGISRIVTQIFFEGNAANDGDPVLSSLPAELRQRLIARREPDEQDGVAAFAIDIKMRGDNETPFFDDLALAS